MSVPLYLLLKFVLLSEDGCCARSCKSVVIMKKFSSFSFSKGHNLFKIFMTS